MKQKITPYLRLHLLVDAVKRQDYVRLEELMDDSKEAKLFYIQNPFEADFFTILLKHNDLKAIDILFHSVNKNLHSLPHPEAYVPHFLEIDNVEIYHLLKKYNLFNDIFEEHITTRDAIGKLAPNTLNMLLNDNKKEFNVTSFNSICKNMFSNYQIKTHFHLPNVIPTIDRFKAVLNIVNQHDNHLIERTLIPLMIDSGVSRLTTIKALPNQESIDKMNAVMMTFLEFNFDPLKTIQEHVKNNQGQLSQKNIKQLNDYPELKDMNFFDIQPFELSQIELEKKYLESKMLRSEEKHSTQIKI